MLVTLAGMVTLARPVQYWKALCPMLVTLFGTALQFLYAYSLVCFVTHKSIPHKELCQYIFLFLFTIILCYSSLFNEYDVIYDVTLSM